METVDARIQRLEGRLTNLERGIEDMRADIRSLRNMESTRAGEFAEVHQLRVTLEDAHRRARSELERSNGTMVESIKLMFDKRDAEHMRNLGAIRASQLEKESRDRLRYLTVLAPAVIGIVGVVMRLPTEYLLALAGGVYALTAKGVEAAAAKDPRAQEERERSMRPPADPSVPVLPAMRPRADSVNYSEIVRDVDTSKTDRVRKP